jgi:hypothetical protein
VTAAGVPRPNYTQVPNVLLDEWLPRIDSLCELKVALAIVRQTCGWHRDRRTLSLTALQRLTGMRRESVVDGLRRAHERGYIDKVAEGRGFSYGLVVEGQMVREPDQSADRTPEGPQTGPSEGPQTGPTYKERGNNPSGGKDTAASITRPSEQSLLLDVEEVAAAPGRPCPTKVDRKAVTAVECSLAWGAMDAFNEAFGTKVSAKGFVEKIIRRQREHPELTLADHQRVIRGVKAGRQWWTGRPDPAIIYGSDEQFERSLANAPVGPSGSSVQSGAVQTPKRDDGWGNLDESIRWD